VTFTTNNYSAQSESGIVLKRIASPPKNRALVVTRSRPGIVGSPNAIDQREKPIARMASTDRIGAEQLVRISAHIPRCSADDAR
jgi:hypothetical protein